MGYFVVTRHAGIQAVVDDRQTFSSENAQAPLQPLRAPQVFADKGIALRLGQRVTGTDRAARRVTLPGHGLAGVFTLRTAGDARRVVVIGGGDACRTRGARAPGIRCAGAMRAR